MKLGISIGYSGADMRMPIEKVLRAEELGYDSVWTAGSLWLRRCHASGVHRGPHQAHPPGGVPGFMQLAGRAPAMAAMQAITVDALAGGNRFILGLGVSGPQIVEGWYGQPWDRPYYRLKDYTQIMKKVFAREALEWKPAMPVAAPPITCVASKR